MARDTYYTRDIWQAAALDCYGIEFLRCERGGDGKPMWIFKNEDDAAFMCGQEFRTEDTMTVPILKFRQSFRFMSRQADEFRDYARRGDEYGVNRQTA